MRWIVVAFLAFCFGLSYWEFASRKQAGMTTYGSDYMSALPHVFTSPIFQLLKSLGALGFIIVPVMAFWQGVVWGIEAMLVFFVAGAVFGVFLTNKTV
jgi:hypothetical protein